MDKRTFWSALSFVIGLVFIASFSIQHDSFYSGICGIIGCIGIIGGFIGLHWQKLQSGNARMKRTVRLLIVLCIVLIILNIIARVLA